MQDVIGTPPESLPETTLWLAELQSVWRQLRAVVHAPDAYLVLNEIERSEAIILTQYKMLIPKIAEDPLHQVLIDQFELVRSGYGAVRELRQLRSPR